MIAVLLALLNSPLVWFGLLVVSLIGAGVLVVLVTRRPQTPPAPTARYLDDVMSGREARYHSSNQIGR